MKRRDLIRRLEKAGFRFYAHGADHDRYIRNTVIEQIPRHKEINEQLARAILKRNHIN